MASIKRQNIDLILDKMRQEAEDDIEGNLALFEHEMYKEWTLEMVYNECTRLGISSV